MLSLLHDLRSTLKITVSSLKFARHVRRVSCAGSKEFYTICLSTVRTGAHFLNNDLYLNIFTIVSAFMGSNFKNLAILLNVKNC